MSERFISTDIALARRLRALESASDTAIRASADLITTMLDACEARKLPACASHDSLIHVSAIMVDAIGLRGKSVKAHQDVAGIGVSLGLPVTAWGDTCPASAQLKEVEHNPADRQAA